MPPRGGNGKLCSIEQWLNYSIFINPSLKGKLVILMCYCLHVKLNYSKLEILTRIVFDESSYRNKVQYRMMCLQKGR